MRTESIQTHLGTLFATTCMSLCLFHIQMRPFIQCYTHYVQMWHRQQWSCYTQTHSDYAFIDMNRYASCRQRCHRYCLLAILRTLPVSLLLPPSTPIYDIRADNHWWNEFLQQPYSMRVLCVCSWWLGEKPKYYTCIWVCAVATVDLIALPCFFYLFFVPHARCCYISISHLINKLYSQKWCGAINVIARSVAIPSLFLSLTHTHTAHARTVAPNHLFL